MKRFKLAMNILITLIGAGVLVIGMGDSFFVGYGAAMMCIGILRIFNYIRYVKSPEYAKKVTVESKDERNLFLAAKAQGTALYAGSIILSAAVPVLHLMGYDEYSVLCGYIVCLYMLINVAVYRIYRRIY